jgi:uncharacterized protein
VERAPELEIGWLETKALLLADPDLRRPRCEGGTREVAVAPSGRLYPCERMVGEDRVALGHGHVDDDSGPLGLRDLAAPSTPAPDAPCGDCAAAPVCANDCACANTTRTGRADLPDGLICALEQACAREAARALKEIALGRRRLPVLAVQGA